MSYSDLLLFVDGDWFLCLHKSMHVSMTSLDLCGISIPDGDAIVWWCPFPSVFFSSASALFPLGCKAYKEISVLCIISIE